MEETQVYSKENWFLFLKLFILNFKLSIFFQIDSFTLFVQKLTYSVFDESKLD